MDANYYHYPGSLDRDEARLHERRRLPDALRRPRRHARSTSIRRTRTSPTRRRQPSRRDRPRCWTTRSDRTATTACSARTCTPTIRPRFRAQSRSCLAAQARSVPVISYKQLLDWVDGRNGSTIRGLSWNAGVRLSSPRSAPAPTGCRRCFRLRARAGTLSALTCAGIADAYTVQTIKGIQYAMFNDDHRHLQGDVFVTRPSNRPALDFCGARQASCR